MELEIVDVETAKLLKEKGFDWNCVNWFKLQNKEWRKVKTPFVNIFTFSY